MQEIISNLDYIEYEIDENYDGLRIDNVYDSTKSLATSYAVWSEDQVRNIQLIASGEKELLQTIKAKFLLLHKKTHL